MKYMLLIYGDEQALSETERKDCYVESTQLAHDIHSSGHYVAANPLQVLGSKEKRGPQSTFSYPN